MDKVMYTPSTPASRIRQHFNPIPLTHSDIDDNHDDTDALEGLIKQTWNVWSVSSLFGFEHKNERQFKIYAKRLREEVASMLPKEDVSYDVKFEIDESLKPLPRPTDPSAVKIRIFAKNANVEAEKCVYTGVLLSWGTTLTELDYERSVKLPLLLCRGTKNTMKAVHITLGNMFDCSIVALPATEEDLKWLVPIILNPSDEYDELAQKEQVRLEYKIPGKLASDSISVKYDISSLVEMWKVIIDNDTDDELDAGFQLKHVEKFYDVLHLQMLQNSGLQLGLCTLHKISLPTLTITDNRLKAATSDILHKVLLFFNERAIQVLHTLSFDSTVSTNNGTR